MSRSNIVLVRVPLSERFLVLTIQDRTLVYLNLKSLSYSYRIAGMYNSCLFSLLLLFLCHMKWDFILEGAQIYARNAFSVWRKVDKAKDALRYFHTMDLSTIIWLSEGVVWSRPPALITKRRPDNYNLHLSARIGETNKKAARRRRDTLPQTRDASVDNALHFCSGEFAHNTKQTSNR